MMKLGAEVCQLQIAARIKLKPSVTAALCITNLCVCTDEACGGLPISNGNGRQSESVLVPILPESVI